MLAASGEDMEDIIAKVTACSSYFIRVGMKDAGAFQSHDRRAADL